MSAHYQARNAEVCGDGVARGWIICNHMKPSLKSGASAMRLYVFATCLFIALYGSSVVAQVQPKSERAPDTMTARVLACASCHGPDGEGTSDAYFPRLAGKPAGYLYNQLVAFRDGRRKYPPMNYLLEFLPDEYLKMIADHFASLRPSFPAPAIPTVSAEILARGQAIATQGDSQRGLPACASCHGSTFGGMEPAIPGLLGLRASYISAQLGGWRYGTRTAIAPDCMQIVAGLLTEDDVKAVAAYLSSRPPATDPSFAKQGSVPMPLSCGSEQN
jgi:cytochrome c553